MNIQNLAEAYDLTEIEAQRMLDQVLKLMSVGATTKHAAIMAYGNIMRSRK